MIEKFRVIPVVVLQNEQEAKEQLSALIEGGLPVAEITFRTEYA
ncbi:MAG: 2-dehydro-3-deoxyphosphogluconate aldolase, partial [Clostridiales bacterium]|nr:2-dehydro-3-deoxyphosphogluconate aldolase [Clostridiales bacterium]